MSEKSKTQGAVPPALRPEEKSSRPFFEDRTEEAVKHGVGFILMGPNVSGASVEALNLPPPPQRANFNTEEGYENCKDSWDQLVAPLLHRPRSSPR